MKFQLVAQDSTTKARLGKIITDHGEITTPVFMPVGTTGTVGIAGTVGTAGTAGTVGIVGTVGTAGTAGTVGSP